MSLASYAVQVVAIRFAILTAALLTALTGMADVLITNVTVHTPNQDVPLQKSSVLVRGDKIVRVGLAENVAAESGIEVVDGGGMVLTSSLFAAYSQLGLNEIDLEAATVDSRVDENGPGPAFDIRRAFNPASVVVSVNLVEGVTHAMVAPNPGPDPLAGTGAVFNLSNGQELPDSSAMFGVVSSTIAPMVGGSRAEVLGRLYRGFAGLSGFRLRNYNPGSGEYSRIDMQALKNFKGNNRPLVVEAHRVLEIGRLLDMAEEFSLSLVILGGTEAWQIADRLAYAGVPVILDPLENRPLTFERLGARLDNAALLHAAGVRIALIVSDNHNARLMRQYAGNAVAHGLPWSAALDAITHTPAEIFGLDKQMGQVVEGAPANLVLWSGDPLQLSTWATRVMVDGEWIDLSSRQTRLFERYRDLSDKTRPFGYR